MTVELRNGEPVEAFELDGKKFYLRRITLRGARDLSALVPDTLEDDERPMREKGPEQVEGLAKIAQFICENEDGEQARMDDVLDGLSPAEVVKLLGIVWGNA